MSTFFFEDGSIIEIDAASLDKLKRAAAQAPLKRARYCLHRDHEEMVQEMVIAFQSGSYVRPHRHVNKSESFHVIEGELTVVFFDELGKVTKRIEMGTPDSGKTFLYRLSDDLWHTVVPRSGFAIIHETTKGPFVPGGDDFAPWSPVEDDLIGVTTFLKELDD